MNAMGHMLVSRVAWDKLTPTARAAVQELNSDPNNPAAGKATTDQDNDVFTAAVWMDDIKPTYKDQHFINTPYQGDGTLPGGLTSVTFLKQELAVLHNPGASKDDKAEALRVTEHLVGDLHMPLHNCDNGDRGGNSFKLNGRDNLHSFWDSAGHQWANIKRPLDEAGKNQISQMAASLESQFPAEQLQAQVADVNPEDWAREGWQLAHRDVYEGVTQGQAPSAEYTQRARQDMNYEAALGGYRLASVLNEVFK